MQGWNLFKWCIIVTKTLICIVVICSDSCCRIDVSGHLSGHNFCSLKEVRLPCMDDVLHFNNATGKRECHVYI